MLNNDAEFACLNSTTIDNFTIFYRAKSELYRSYDEIFIKKIYDILPSNHDGLVIDGGAHIGISSLFLRRNFPNAKIIAFEPNPYTFEILKKNIQCNNVTNIELINAALSNEDGSGFLYGILNGENADTRGNSTIPSWGNRTSTDKILVEKVKLSNFFNARVYFLKLDIEGAEHEVLCELESKLDLVENVFIDFHGTKTNAESNLDEIKTLLVNHGFDLSINIKDPSKSLPPKWNQWIEEVNPVMAQIFGKKS